MKTRTLALRVTLNSIVMIFFVYLVMQTVVFFRDAVIFSTNDMSDFGSAVGGFIGGRVVPPLLVFGFILWLIALPIQKIQARLEAGEVLGAEETERVRTTILRFKVVVLIINLIGFTVAFFLDLILSNKLAELADLHRQIILLSNLTAAWVFSSAQTALNNVAFAPLRDRLGITSIGNRKKESASTVRQIRMTAALVLYSALVVQYNQWDVTNFQSWGHQILGQVQAGTLTTDEALPAYRALVADKMGLITSRSPEIAKTVPAPWSEGAPQAADQQQAVFLIMFGLMLFIVVALQYSLSREQRSWLLALRGRIQDVVEGGGDLRKRLSLRSMDDLGELAELVNRLLDQFHTIVGRIGAAAGQTREGAQALEAVLARAEETYAQVGESVKGLKIELEDQANQARILSEALGAFREAAAAVDTEASTQSRFVGETSAAMDEMGASIEGVREKSRQAGTLTEALSRQGEGGGQAVRETAEAITGIHRTSLQVLDVLGALKKIAADTNLLAMNAAIEAAHAGDKGAGFAVVADEVRKLANTAQSQTKAIKDLIQAMARQVEAGVERAQASGKVLAELVKGLQDSAHVSRAVAEAMEEQAGRTRDVGNSLGQVVRTSDTIRSKMTVQGETTDRMSESLGQTLDRLAALVMTSQRQALAVSSLEASFAEVRREVDRNAAAAETLRAEIGRFQV